MGSLAFMQPIEVSGRKFSTKQIQQIQDTVATFKHLSRTELAITICEHLNWMSPIGRPKVKACLLALKRFENMGILSLPAAQVRVATPQRSYSGFTESLIHMPLNGSLSDVAPLELRRVITKDQRHLWNGYIERYHYLGYKTPFGPHLKYFIVSRKLQEQYLGCVLFAPAAWALKSRDEWIGWYESDKKKRLSLIINNSRFLIFPWVKVECLASQVLSMTAAQVAADWHDSYGYRPVLLETFVDPTRFEGTCYQAANWQFIGNTTGRGRTGQSHEINTTSKKIFVYPLTQTFRATLRGEQSSIPLPRNSQKNLEFNDLWQQVVDVIDRVTSEHDEVWQKRDRIINSMMLVLIIFRVLLAKNSQGYHTTILEFWDICHGSKLSLPQKRPIAPSSFSEARGKLDENIFKEINSAVIRAQEDNQPNQFHWKEHRLFAVDGSKINLPRTMLKHGFDQSPHANYPQGLLSTLYQLKSKLPYDFELVKQGDERACALSHLSALKANDVVVYDRGYFSYQMLYKHLESGIHAIFRLQRNSFTAIASFIAQSALTDTIVTIEPGNDTRRDIAGKHPELSIRPLKLRLIKYTYEGTEYYLGSTLHSDSYSITDFSNVYHSRWGIEELYKISKKQIEVEDFHGRNERGIRQELYAHFVLITLSRLFANHGDFEKNDGPNKSRAATRSNSKNTRAPRPLDSIIRVNFKNCISALEFRIERLLLNRNENLATQIDHTINRTIAVSQAIRPNRSYLRISMKPDSRWQPNKKNKNKSGSQNQQNMNVVTA